MRTWCLGAGTRLTYSWSHFQGGGGGEGGRPQAQLSARPLQSVEGEQHEKAVELLKAAQGSVKLVVRYTPRVLEEMEARFEKMRSARRRQQHQSYS